MRGLLADYYATPPTWAVARAVETVAAALNRWVIAEAGRNAAIELEQATISDAIISSAAGVGFAVESQTVEVVGLCAGCQGV